MQDREEWLARLLKRFADLKAAAEAREAKEKLSGASDAETKELLRRIQQSQKRPGKAAEGAPSDQDQQPKPAA
jgi:DNA primase